MPFNAIAQSEMRRWALYRKILDDRRRLEICRNSERLRPKRSFVSVRWRLRSANFTLATSRPPAAFEKFPILFEDNPINEISWIEAQLEKLVEVSERC
jgi:hypothetical protein